MAIQTGIIKLSGKVGDLVHFQRDGKHFTKAAAESYKLSERSKKSGRDFGTASAAAVLVNKGFLRFRKKIGDNKFIYRLNKVMAAIVNTAPAELQGKRQVTDGDVALLKQLEFNMYTKLEKLVTFEPKVEIDPCEKLTITIPQMPIKDMFHVPPDAHGAIIHLLCCSFYFDERNGRFAEPDDLFIKLNKASKGGGTLELPLDARENKVIALGMGVRFLTSSDRIPSGNRRFYAGKIIEAFNIRNGEVVQFIYPEPEPAPDNDAPKQNPIKWNWTEEE